MPLGLKAPSAWALLSLTKIAWLALAAVEPTCRQSAAVKVAQLAWASLHRLASIASVPVPPRTEPTARIRSLMPPPASAWLAGLPPSERKEAAVEPAELEPNTILPLLVKVSRPVSVS